MRPSPYPLPLPPVKRGRGKHCLKAPPSLRGRGLGRGRTAPWHDVQGESNCMGRIKHSVSWWCFVPGKMTPEAFVRAAAEIGYQGIDLVSPDNYQLVRDHGL